MFSLPRMIFTPGQLHRRAEFYYQLGQLLKAGITLPQALERFAAHPPARAFRRPLQNLTAALNQGLTFASALREANSWLPELDIAVLQAGEESGRLDGSLAALSDYYQARAQTARQFLGDLAYPAFLLHFAVFILPFPEWFASGDSARYLYKTLGILLPIYAVTVVTILAMQNRHAELWRACVEAVLRFVPVLGTARRSLALSRLCLALESLISAGITIVQAWDLAAAASGSPALRRIVRRWQAPLEAGETPADLVDQTRFFPELFASQYRSGEISGKLDEILRRLHGYYAEDGTRRIRALAQWLPRLVYLLLALYIGYRVISFWQGYFDQLKTIGDF